MKSSAKWIINSCYTNNNRMLVNFIKLLFVPSWILLKFSIFKWPKINRKIFFLIRSDIFGNQIVDFVYLNFICIKLPDEIIYYYPHPHVVNYQLFEVQTRQISQHKNLRQLNSLTFIILFILNEIDRAASNKLGLFRTKLLNNTPKFDSELCRSIFGMYSLPEFPNISQEMKSVSKNKILACQALPQDIYLVGVLIRSNLTEKYHKFSSNRFNQDFRNSSLNFSSMDIENLLKNKLNLINMEKENEIRNLTINLPFLKRHDSHISQLDEAISLDFFVGTLGGPASLIVNQNIPSIFVDVTPVERFPIANPKICIAIPKRIWNKKDKKFLSLNEQYSKSVANIFSNYDSKYILQADLELIEMNNNQKILLISKWLNFYSDTNENKFLSDMYLSSVEKSEQLRNELNENFLWTFPEECWNLEVFGK